LPKIIKIRLKGYGDNGRMEDVGEIEIPDDAPPVKSITIKNDPTKFYRLGSATIEFDNRIHHTLG
jgi:hypothetical protein